MWYDEPYQGGTPVVVRGFPRALYPQDAISSGKVPTVNGPDVEAAKRVVSRAGRWPWAAFDQTYSNGFSHGKSGNVGETGIAGLQRQLGIPDTGWFGKETFTAMRYIRIPDGLPNAGQPAMDARAVELFNQAYEEFRPTINTRQRALTWMIFRNGWMEQPPGSNTDQRSEGIKYAQFKCANGADWLYKKPWCGVWCWAALDHAGVEGIDSHLASVALIEHYARLGQKCYSRWTFDKSLVREGDLAVIGGPGVHVAMVRAVGSSTILTQEGNTSPGIVGSQANGIWAGPRERPLNQVHGYALVEYPGD